MHPDFQSDPGGNFFVGDLVTVDVQRLVPWRAGMQRYELKEWGYKNEYYEEQFRPGDSWNPEQFKILCFATMQTERRRGLKIEGVFAILAKVVNGCLYEFTPGADRVASPVPLHWVGALEKVGEDD